MVHTCNWYKMVVFPAASRPTIKIRMSWSLRHFVKEESVSKIVLKVSPIYKALFCSPVEVRLWWQFNLCSWSSPWNALLREIQIVGRFDPQPIFSEPKFASDVSISPYNPKSKDTCLCLIWPNFSHKCCHRLSFRRSPLPSTSKAIWFCRFWRVEQRAHSPFRGHCSLTT